MLFGVEALSDGKLIGAVRLRQVFRRDGQWYDMFTMGLLEGEFR